MVPDLQDIALQVIPRSHDAVLGYDARIAHEQEGDLIVGDFQYYRILIEVICKERCWRREDLDLNGRIEIDGLAPFGGAKGNVLPIYQVQVVLEGLRRMCLAAVQNLLDRDVIQDSYQPADVVFVRMAGDQEIQA